MSARLALAVLGHIYAQARSLEGPSSRHLSQGATLVTPFAGPFQNVQGHLTQGSSLTRRSGTPVWKRVTPGRGFASLTTVGRRPLDPELGVPTEVRQRSLTALSLNHPAQLAIQRLAQEQPGLNIHELAARLALSRSATRYHLRSLVRSGKILTKRQGHHLLHFPGNMNASQRTAVSLLRINSVRLVVEKLVATPTIQPAPLAAELGVSARSVRRSIKMLVRAGLAITDVSTQLGSQRVTLHPDARLAYVMHCKEIGVKAIEEPVAPASAWIVPVEALLSFLAALVAA